MACPWLLLLLLCCPLLCLTDGTYQQTCPVVPPCQCVWRTDVTHGQRNSVQCERQHLARIPRILQNIESYVYKANFSNNSLSDVSQDAVNAFKWTLEILDLSTNQLQQLGHVSALVNLTHLILANNDLQLPQSPFKNMDKLEYLDLSSNVMVTIADGAFKGLSKLNFLSLKNCLIESIPPNTFEDATELETLNLMGNYLKTLDPRLSTHLLSLKNLDLSNNKIETISYEMLGDLPLVLLELNKNKIKSIANDTFRGVGPTLVELDLNDNFIADINEHTFSHLRRLRVLRMGWNLIESIPERMLIDSTRLIILSLPDNKIASIPPQFFQGIKLLSILDLTSNSIDAVPSVKGLHKLNYLFLDNTGIRTLWPCQLQDQLNSGVQFHLWLASAPLHCDCQLRWLLQWLQNGLLREEDTIKRLGLGVWKCQSPAKLRGKLFHALTEEDLQCIDAQQPEYCPSDHHAKPDLDIYIKNHTETSITISWHANLPSAEILQAVEISWIDERNERNNLTQNRNNSLSIIDPDFTISDLKPGDKYSICVKLYAAVHNVPMDLASKCLHNVPTKIMTLEQPYAKQQRQNAEEKRQWGVILPVAIVAGALICTLGIIVFFLVRRYRRLRLKGKRNTGTNLEDLQGTPNPMFELHTEVEEENDNYESLQRTDNDMQNPSYDLPYEDLKDVNVTDTTI